MRAQAGDGTAATQHHERQGPRGSSAGGWGHGDLLLPLGAGGEGGPVGGRVVVEGEGLQPPAAGEVPPLAPVAEGVEGQVERLQLQACREARDVCRGEVGNHCSLRRPKNLETLKMPQNFFRQNAENA